MKCLPIKIVLLGALFPVSFLSCSNHKNDPLKELCSDTTKQAKCYPIKFKELLENSFHYANKCVQIEGYLSLNFEDVALYRSNAERKNLQSEHAYWLNFGDLIIRCIESKGSALSEQKVIIRGVINTKRKGHLNAYAGEIDNVFYVQLINNP